MEKKEILSKLYTIRASLSLISVMKDDADKDNEDSKSKINSEIDKISDLRKPYQERIDSINKNTRDLSKEIKENESRINYLEEQTNKKRNYAPSTTPVDALIECYDFTGYDRPWNNGKVGIGLGVIAIIICFLLGHFKWIRPLHSSESTAFMHYVGLIIQSALVGVGTFAALTFVLIPILTFIFYIFENIIAHKKYNKKLESDLSREIEHKNELKQNYELALKDKSEIPACDEQIKIYDKEIAELKNAHKEYNETRNEALVIDCDAVYNTTVEECSTILDPRDWKYLDYIIYTFETGRSETIKEALQQLDHLLQTQEIINAVNIATNELSNQIKNSTQMITKTIENSASVICATIVKEQEKNRAAIRNATEQISSKLDTVNSSIGQVISTQAMTNALIKKANESTEKLIRDYESVHPLETLLVR